jgi:hypothetical protein
MTKVEPRKLDAAISSLSGSLRDLVESSEDISRTLNWILEQKKQESIHATHGLSEPRDIAIVTRDVERAAIHEAGHLIVATRLGMHGSFQLTNEFEEYRSKCGSHPVVDGKVTIHSMPYGYDLSTIAWGGIIAESLYNRSAEAGVLLGDVGALERLVALASKSDRDDIFCQPQPWRAGMKAAKLIAANMREIHAIKRTALKEMITQKKLQFDYSTNMIKHDLDWSNAY